MMIRIAQVAWWLGAVMMALLIFAYMRDSPGHLHLYSQLLFLLPLVLVAWIVSFVLGGSFWKPPKSKSRSSL